MPRSSNSIPDPATRSFTVRDTRTSPALASLATHAPISAATAFGNRLNETLTECLPGNVLRQIVLLDKTIRPHLLHQFFLGENVTRVFNQRQQRSEERRVGKECT